MTPTTLRKRLIHMLPLRQPLRVAPQPVRVDHERVDIHMRTTRQREQRSSVTVQARAREEEDRV